MGNVKNTGVKNVAYTNGSDLKKTLKHKWLKEHRFQVKEIARRYLYGKLPIKYFGVFN